MRQSRVPIFVEFKTFVNTDEVEKKIRMAFPDNIRTLIVGVDHRNFAGMMKTAPPLFNGDGVEKTIYELLSKEAEPMSITMRCSSCNRTWPAHGYQSSEGRFLKEGSEICQVCHREGERLES